MHLKQLVLSIATLSAAATPVLGADSAGRYAIDGAGGTTCQAYLDAREENAGDFRVYAGWVDGYVTAFNHFNSDTYDLTPWQTVELTLAKLARYCEGQPEERFVNALNLLGQLLYSQRLTDESEIIQARVGDQGTVIYKDMLPRIRTALEGAGYDPGPTADAFTRGLSSALRRFQRDKGLQPSGLPDQVTLNSLLP